MKRVNASKLRHRGTFLHKVIGQDKWGQPTETWQEFATVWCSVEPISGKEYWSGVQVQSELTHRIRIRYLAGLDPTMLFLFKGRVFEIEPPRDIEERTQEMEIMAKEKNLAPDFEVGDGLNTDAILGPPDGDLSVLSRLLGGG